MEESRLAGRVASWIGIVSGLVLGACLCLGVSAASAANPGPFRWLVPAPAPHGWQHISLPAGDAVLSYPPSLAPIHADRTSVSVAKRDTSGTIHVYLNATPQQGTETLSNWTAFRITHNRYESDAVHEHAAGVGLRFLGAKGSCVIDDYLSRVHVHHYREIACIVQGRTKVSVIVAAALQSEWTRAAPLLERAISAYRAG
jgi:hypothetical protein